MALVIPFVDQLRNNQISNHQLCDYRLNKQGNQHFVTTTTIDADAVRKRSPWPTFALCALGAYITALDLSIVNVAFPEILRQFKSTRADVSWVVTTYNICFGSLLVIAGKTADQLGRRRLFRIGVVIFGLGSLMCAVAPTLSILIGGRAIQGLGGALLTPATLGLLLAAFPIEKRTQIVAMWGGIGALGVASGPSLGALIITLTNWRAAFAVNLPICVGLLAFSGRYLIETARVRSAQRPDYLGALFITASLGSLALGISRSDAWGWASAATIGSLLLAIICVPIFVARQRRHPEPILDLSLFKSRSFSVANLAGIAFFAGFAASGLNNVLFLRQVWGYTVLHAGLLSALAPATVAILAPFTGKLASRIGFRPLLIAGPCVVAAGALAFAAFIAAKPAPWLFVAIAELNAVGIAMFIPVSAGAAVADLPPARLSIGGAVNNTSRQVGSVLGIAILVAVLGSPKTLGALLDAHHRGFVAICILMIFTAMISIAQPGRATSLVAGAR